MRKKKFKNCLFLALLPHSSPKNHHLPPSTFLLPPTLFLRPFPPHYLCFPSLFPSSLPFYPPSPSSPSHLPSLLSVLLVTYSRINAASTHSFRGVTSWNRPNHKVNKRSVLVEPVFCWTRWSGGTQVFLWSSYRWTRFSPLLFLRFFVLILVFFSRPFLPPASYLVPVCVSYLCLFLCSFVWFSLLSIVCVLFVGSFVCLSVRFPTNEWVR